MRNHLHVPPLTFHFGWLVILAVTGIFIALLAQLVKSNPSPSSALGFAAFLLLTIGLSFVPLWRNLHEYFHTVKCLPIKTRMAWAVIATVITCLPGLTFLSAAITTKMLVEIHWAHVFLGLA